MSAVERLAAALHADEHPSWRSPEHGRVCPSAADILAADPALARRYELGEAWEECEAAAAAGDGRWLQLTHHAPHIYNARVWQGAHTTASQDGPTPTEALRALTAELRKVTP